MKRGETSWLTFLVAHQLTCDLRLGRDIQSKVKYLLFIHTDHLVLWSTLPIKRLSNSAPTLDISSRKLKRLIRFFDGFFSSFRLPTARYFIEMLAVISVFAWWDLERAWSVSFLSTLALFDLVVNHCQMRGPQCGQIELRAAKAQKSCRNTPSNEMLYCTG